MAYERVKPTMCTSELTLDVNLLFIIYILNKYQGKVKGKALPLQAIGGPEGSR